MLRNIKKFLYVQFKIEECHDDVFDDSSSEDEKEANNGEEGEAEQIED